MDCFGTAPPIEDPDLLCDFDEENPPPPDIPIGNPAEYSVQKIPEQPTEAPPSRLIPDNEPCPPYEHLPEYRYQVTCPEQRTYQELRDAFAEVLYAGNSYRMSRGMQPLQWDDHLAAAAQWFASWFREQANNNLPHDVSPGDVHGETLPERINNAGFPLLEDKAYQHREGSVWFAGLGTNPMQVFCKFKNKDRKVADHYQSDTNAGPFAPFVDDTSPNVIGFTHFGGAWKNNVVVYLWATIDPSGTYGDLPPIEDPDFLCEPQPKNPLNHDCGTYDEAAAQWPITCPDPISYERLRIASAQPIAEGNTYRTARGMEPLVWLDNLAYAAQIQASYLYKTWANRPTTVDGEQLNKLTHVQKTPEVPGRVYFWHRMAEGNVTDAGASAAEGIGGYADWLHHNPQTAFCQFKQEYINDQQALHFLPWVNSEDPAVVNYRYVGVGYKEGIVVWLYAGGPNIKIGAVPPLSQVGDPAILCQ